MQFLDAFLREKVCVLQLSGYGRCDLCNQFFVQREDHGGVASYAQKNVVRIMSVVWKGGRRSGYTHALRH